MKKTIDDVINILYDSGATEYAILIQNIYDEDQQQIVKCLNDYKGDNIVSFIIKLIQDLGYKS